MRPIQIPLDSHLNACAATFDDDRSDGCLTAWGNSYPAEELPFGRLVTVGGVPYRLAEKQAGAPDHVEMLGQRIATDHAGERVVAVAALCCAEMGDRAWRLLLEGPDGRASLDLPAPRWTLAREETAAGVISCSHLHYPDYELEHLRPVIWSVVRSLPAPIHVDWIDLPERPLIHLFALSLMTMEAGHG